MVSVSGAPNTAIGLHFIIRRSLGLSWLTGFEVRSAKDSPGYQDCHTRCSEREDYIDNSAKRA